MKYYQKSNAQSKFLNKIEEICNVFKNSYIYKWVIVEFYI